MRRTLSVPVLLCLTPSLSLSLSLRLIPNMPRVSRLSTAALRICGRAEQVQLMEPVQSVRPGQFHALHPPAHGHSPRVLYRPAMLCVHSLVFDVPPKTLRA